MSATSLYLHKEQARQACRTQRASIRDEMDVSLMMLPADFLFQHKFTQYAQERSFENVVRVMERLVSTALVRCVSLSCDSVLLAYSFICILHTFT